MRFITQINQYLALEDEYGKLDNQQIAIYGKSGHGKGLSSEGIIEEFHKKGYTIICIADPKGVWELAFQMFKPTARYHLDHLKKIGKTPQEKRVKLYHPFTFSIPSKEYLPDINFFTFSLKQLGRPAWSLINETESDKDTIQIILQASKEINNVDGINILVKNMERLVKGRSEKKAKRYDPKNFYLETGVGTTKTLSEISRHLRPFKTDFFLVNDSCKYNIEWEKILSDQENYHVFSTHWVRDEKMQDFVGLALFDGLVEALRHSKKANKILIYIPEINKWCPAFPEGHKRILSRYVKSYMGIIRNMGSSSLTDSQVWVDVDQEVRDKATETFVGSLRGGVDIDRFTKSFGYKPSFKENILHLKRNFYYRIGDEENRDEPIVIWLSSGGHKEEDENFFQRYKKEKRPVKRYDDLFKEMKRLYDDEETKIRDRMRKLEKSEKERLEKEKREKEMQSQENKNVEKVKEKTKEIQNKSKEQLMKLIYDFKNDDSIERNQKSWRKIGQRFGLNHITAKNYYLDYEQKLDEGIETENDKTQTDERR